MNTKALREKILDLAMRGKLVEQNPSDEPANELLQKIQAEKEQLIKNKKIKKEKPLPEISEEDIPFEIPESWGWVRLGNISNTGDFQSIKPLDIMPESWLLELEDIEKNTGKLLQKRVVKSTEIKSNKYKFHKDDVLYGKLRPYLRKILLAEQDGYCSTEIFPLTINSPIDSKLILYWLKSDYISKMVDASMYGVNLPRVSPKFFVGINLPLPPLAEQKRIVAKIEELFALIDTIEMNLTEYNQLTEQLDKKVLDLAMRGKLVEQDPNDESASELLKKIRAEKEQLVKDKKIKKEKPLPEIREDEVPFDIPENWKWVRLSDVSKEIFAGGDKPKVFSKEKYSKISVPVYANGVTAKGLYGYTDIPRVLESAITISARGTIGYSVIREEPFVPIVRLLVIIPFKQFVSHKFVKLFFDYSIETGEGTSIKQLTVPGIKPRLIPIPPLKEQKRIVSKIEEIRAELQR